MITKYALPFAGILALTGASCATTHQASESPNPTTREVASSQKASEEALKRAQDAQKQASEQSQKAAEAQARVRQDEEKLRQDQETSRQEQAKAQQLQTQARQESAQASQQVQQQQQRAATGLSQQTEELARGQQTAAGIVTQVRPDELVVQPPSGQAMRFRVDDSTDVRIDGRKSSADQIREGQQARVSYEPSANGPSAVTIVVSGARANQGMGSSGGTSTGTGSTSEPQNQTPEPQSPPQSGSQSHGY